MASKRNAPEKFYGSNLAQMPLLIKQGMIPISVSRMMELRLAYRNCSKNAETKYINDGHDTGDVIIHHPNGNYKIVLDCPTLREMTIQSQRNDYGELIIGENVYNSLKGEVFRERGLGQCYTDLSSDVVRSNPVWQILARDKNLLNEYIDLIFEDRSDPPNFELSYKMGFYRAADRDGSGQIRMFMFHLGSLGHSRLICGKGDLNHISGRLLGVAP